MKLVSLKLSLLIFVTSALSASADVGKTPIKIGMLLPMSGSYAPVGVDTRQGVEIAQAELSPNQRMEFVFADSKADGAQSVTEFRKLHDTDKVLAVYAFRGPVGMAVNPLSKQTGTPLLGGVGNKDFATSNSYAFQIWPRSDTEGAYLASTVQAMGLKKIAVITVQDDWPVAVAEGFRQSLKRSGGTLVFDEEILPTDNDFKSVITKIRGSNPDAVFVNVALTQIAPFVRQMKDMKVSLPTFSNFWAGKKDVIDSSKDVMEGVMFAEMATDLTQLKEDLKRKYNSTPSGATVSAYVATMLLAQSLDGMKDASANSLYSRLIAQKEIRTRNGSYQIKDRCVEFPMTLRVIHDGEVEDAKLKSRA